MSNDQIKITHHPATDTAPRHWRSSDGHWTTNGMEWYDQNGLFVEGNRHPRAAFFSQILNAEPEPRRAKVGDRVRGVAHTYGEGEFEIHSIGDKGITTKRPGTIVSPNLSNTTYMLHGTYTIVDPPVPLTAKGNAIRHKDGVWELKNGGDFVVRFLVLDNEVVARACRNQNGNVSHTFYLPLKIPHTHISDDPRDLTNWEVE